MRILMPNGTLAAVEKAVPVNEQRISFNGREIRLCERAAQIGYANGLGFFLAAQVHNNCGMVMGDAVFIGNLPNELVREVLAALAQQGYVDLSDLKLQKTQPLTSNYVFDNGASGAYTLQGYEASMCCADTLGYPFMGMGGAVPAVSEDEDAEDAEEEDDDE